MTLFVGIDLGTSGCRAVAIDDDGRVRGEARTALPPPAETPPQVEQDPELWWQALQRVLEGLFRQVPPAQVQALAVDGTSATVLATDADGIPLGPALLYSDTRCRDTAALVDAAAPAQSPARGPGSSLAKALYLLQIHPHAAHVLHQADWLLGRLCGQPGWADENNCLKMGFDAVRRAWPTWLDRLPFPAALRPRVLPAGRVVGPVARPWRRHWGLPREAVMTTGTTDSTAAVLAAGVREPGDAVTALGSTLVVKVLSEHPVSDADYGVYSHRVGDRWLAGGASNSGGAVLLQFFSEAELRALTPALTPEMPTGLDYYPLPRPGERFPINDPDLAPRLTPRPGDPARFLQGLLEGMAAIEHRGYRLLQRLGAPYPTRVQTVGGGAANPAWTALRAGALGVPVVAAAHHEAAYGSALLARSALTGR